MREWPTRLVWAFRIGNAAVWITMGLFWKVLGLVPRHQEIVAVFVGGALSRPMTVTIGLAEVGMALWILSGWRSRQQAVLQLVVVVAMNVLEIIFARDLLLAPYPMLVGNVALASVNVWVAWHDVPVADWARRLWLAVGGQAGQV